MSEGTSISAKCEQLPLLPISSAGRGLEICFRFTPTAVCSAIRFFGISPKAFPSLRGRWLAQRDGRGASPTRTIPRICRLQLRCAIHGVSSRQIGRDINFLRLRTHRLHPLKDDFFGRKGPRNLLSVYTNCGMFCHPIFRHLTKSLPLSEGKVARAARRKRCVPQAFSLRRRCRRSRRMRCTTHSAARTAPRLPCAKGAVSAAD